MKAYGGVDVQIQVFLNSELAGGEWSASRPGRFIPVGRAPGTLPKLISKFRLNAIKTLFKAFSLFIMKPTS
jgi:hypothetical protein